MSMRIAFVIASVALAGIAIPANTQLAAQTVAPAAMNGPKVDHHQHLLSPAVAELITGGSKSDVILPAEVRSLLRKRTAAWNDAKALAPL
jgi:hypothetical protein